MELKEKVTVLKGVGPKKAAALEKLGIRTIEDLISFFPGIIRTDGLSGQ